ncbi:MAG: NADH dehydrogenase subunit C [Candidatus Methanohalarchaeum thermophilum]|uniref:NADH dehydrogenase subunit C n=1 Tax=Methanohalarchaeum thermophilum TaxID=1903181 RepID=A0A1Q6DXA4_METT1|nr:MAG: NADH dehydrogenase subunit C [Candidatus Methanohalarchaeum thermophilum]
MDKLEEYSIEKDKEGKIKVDKNNLKNICKTAIENEFDRLSSLTAVDYKDYMEVVYHLGSYEHKEVLVVKVKVDKEDPKVPTVSDIWSYANWYEREVWEMFGIDFKDNSDLRKLLLPEEIDGNPLRKEYPIGGRE